MREMVFVCAGFVLGSLCGGVTMYLCWLAKKSKELQKRSNAQRYLDLVNQWLIVRQNGYSVAGFLAEKHMCRIAVYGMGLYGRHLVRELQHSDISIEYGIDCKKMKPYQSVCVRQPVEDLEKVDAIINTVIWDHDNIERRLSAKMDCRIVNLEDIIFEIIPADKSGWEQEAC